MENSVSKDIKLYIPKHLQDVATRMSGLQYRVQYRSVGSSQSKRRKSRREVLEGQSENFTKIRLTVIWSESKGFIVNLEGSIRDDMGQGMKLFPFPNMNEFWLFAERYGRCPCGRKMLSEDSARLVLEQAIKRRTLQGNLHREERWKYPCPKWGKVFHVKRGRGRAQGETQCANQVAEKRTFRL